MDQEIRWLLIEGVMPLLGAAFLYTLYGICSYIVTSSGSTFAYQWTQAIDSLGWLYGGTIIAVQTGLKGVGVKEAGVLPVSCFIVSAICLLILLAAMGERGRNMNWQPSVLLKLSSAALVGIILWAGYETQVLMKGVAQ